MGLSLTQPIASQASLPPSTSQCSCRRPSSPAYQSCTLCRNSQVAVKAVSILRHRTVVRVAYKGEDKVVPPDFGNLQDNEVMGSLSKHACCHSHWHRMPSPSQHDCKGCKLAWPAILWGSVGRTCASVRLCSGTYVGRASTSAADGTGTSSPQRRMQPGRWSMHTDSAQHYRQALASSVHANTSRSNCCSCAKQRKHAGG